jgi:hypothetical protein
MQLDQMNKLKLSRPGRAKAAFGFERLIKGAPPGDGVSALHTPDFPFGKGGARGVWRGAGVGVSSCTDVR